MLNKHTSQRLEWLVIYYKNILIVDVFRYSSFDNTKAYDPGVSAEVMWFHSATLLSLRVNLLWLSLQYSFWYFRLPLTVTSHRLHNSATAWPPGFKYMLLSPWDCQQAPSPTLIHTHTHTQYFYSYTHPEHVSNTSCPLFKMPWEPWAD